MAEEAKEAEAEKQVAIAALNNDGDQADIVEPDDTRTVENLVRKIDALYAEAETKTDAKEVLDLFRKSVHVSKMIAPTAIAQSAAGTSQSFAHALSARS